jgi:hypothetical protein
VANCILFTNVTNNSGTSVLLSIGSSFQGYFWQKASSTQLQLFTNGTAILTIEFSISDATFSLHNWMIGQLIQALDYSDSQTYVLPQLPAVGGAQAYIFDII